MRVKLNSTQRLFITILLPFVIHLITYIIAEKLYWPKESYNIVIREKIWGISLFITGLLVIFLIDLKASNIKKIILAVLVPIEIFIIIYALANNSGSAFDLEDTWWVWLEFLVIVGVYEYLLFRESTENKLNKGQAEN